MEKNNVNKNDAIDEIRTLMDEKVKSILLCEPEKMKKEIFYMKLNQAKLGMVYTRDRELMKRVNSGQMIRVVNLIATSPIEKKAYLTATMPELSVVDQIEGK